MRDELPKKSGYKMLFYKSFYKMIHVI